MTCLSERRDVQDQLIHYLIGMGSHHLLLRVSDEFINIASKQLRPPNQQPFSETPRGIRWLKDRASMGC